MTAQKSGDGQKGRLASRHYGEARYWVPAYVDRLQKAVKARRVACRTPGRCLPRLALFSRTSTRS